VVWWQGAVGELRATVAADRLAQTGVPGALFGDDIFERDRGRATVYIPVDRHVPTVGRERPFTVPPAELAVVRHRGPHDDVEPAHSAPGRYATEHETGVAGPCESTASTSSGTSMIPRSG
jgi:effector-binding domain-containing protein